MHSYILISRNQQVLEEKINHLCGSARRIDREITKISDVREFGRLLSISLEPTTYTIHEFHTATHEAQSAFLKNLEEGSSGATFIIVAESIGNIIPTIRSRCQIIKDYSTPEISADLTDKTADFINKSVTEKLVHLQSIKSKEDAIDFLGGFISAGHKLLIESTQKNKLAKSLEEAQVARKNILANCNPILQLTNFVIHS